MLKCDFNKVAEHLFLKHVWMAASEERLLVSQMKDNFYLFLVIF